MSSKFIESIYVSIILIISIFSVWYFGFVNINPIDNFTIYNSGFLILKGNVPFKDYWVTTGPLLDFLQFLIFKLYGVNWGSYVLHAAIVNSLFTVLLYYVFRKFNLEKKFSFIYSTSTGLIFYSQLGTPFVDHHSSLFSILSILFLILGINFRKNIYWFLVPIFLILAFLSKQTPASYFAIIIIFFTIYNLTFEKNFNNLLFSLISSLLIIFFLVLLFYYQDISIKSFYNQYIVFASSVGQIRLEVDGFLKPFTFSRYFIKFKLIHISYFILIIYIIKNCFLNKIFFKSKEFITILLLISSAYVLILHQLLTLNSKFIYFYIPILCGFTHIFIKKNFNFSTRIISINLLILMVAFSYYFSSYVLQQKFQYFCSDRFKNVSPVKTKIIDNKFNFTWKSCLEKNPIKEINNLIRVIDFLNINSKDNYLLITDYQFLNTKLESNKNKQVNKWYHPGVSYPLQSEKNHKYYEDFLIKKIKLNNIKKIIFVYPSYFGTENEIYFKNIFSNCISEDKKLLDDLITSFNIEKCF